MGLSLVGSWEVPDAETSSERWIGGGGGGAAY